MYDTLIKNVVLYDGTGSSPYSGHVLLKDGSIAAIVQGLPPEDEKSAQVIDGVGLALAPGFIDMHSHSELDIMRDPLNLAKLRQGVTLEVFGQDGLGPAPVNRVSQAARQRYLKPLAGPYPEKWNWQTFGEFLEALRAAKGTLNAATLVPHGAIRDVVMGMENRPATAAELYQMKNLLGEALDAGAKGMSLGLIYIPSVYAPFEELVVLSEVVARRGKLLVAQMRNEGDRILQSIDEMLQLGRRTGVKVHLSHLKIVGRNNWSLIDQIFASFDKALTEGINLSFDQYPYSAGCTTLTALLPSWAQAGGADKLLTRLKDPFDRQHIIHDLQVGLPGWENLARACGWEGIFVSSVGSARSKACEGRHVAELAAERGVTPPDLVFDLLVEEDLDVGMIDFYGSHEVVKAMLTHPLQMVGTDGIPNGKPHPRLYGTFPRLLGYYTRDEGCQSLEETVRKATGAAAARLNLSDRGLLKEGYRADLVLFNPATICDRATYRDPQQYPTGIEWVFVNGLPVLANGEITGVQGCGTVLT
ncbi:MAG: D-aminoacylase [Chloroflexota bacterium]|nr:D-aminoacylase [Chloroflexota bacterium]